MVIFYSYIKLPEGSLIPNIPEPKTHDQARKYCLSQPLFILGCLRCQSSSPLHFSRLRGLDLSNHGATVIHGNHSHSSEFVIYSCKSKPVPAKSEESILEIMS